MDACPTSFLKKMSHMPKILPPRKTCDNKGNKCRKVGTTSTLNMIFSITYYLGLLNANVYLILYQQMSNWFFGHYRVLTTSLGNKKNTSIKNLLKNIALRKSE